MYWKKQVFYMKSNDLLLEVRNLYFKYPGKDFVLRDLNLTLEKGEHVLIIGDTGSGKTTLARVLTRIAFTVYGGEARGVIKIGNRNLFEINNEELFEKVHLIGQNPYMYFTELIVRDDIYNYALRIHRSHDKAVKSFSKVVEATGIHKLLDRYFYELSGGEARRVLVAKALISNPDLLIFDEPLMWLDEKGVEDFKELLKLLRFLGKGVIVFEHRFLPLLREVDRIYLLRDGKLVDVTELALKLSRTRSSLRNDLEKASVVNPGERNSNNRQKLLEAHGIYYSINGVNILKNIDLSIYENDLILIYGLNGSGKTTLLKVLAGYLKPTKGIVKRYCDIMYIPQNIILFYTEDSVISEIREICRSRKLGENCIKEGVKKVMSLNIDINESPFNLSYGQMVKLAVTIANLSKAKLLLLDEPFSGSTYSDRAKLLEYLRGASISALITTSNLDAYQGYMWSKTYRLEDGELSELGIGSRDTLGYAAWLYEEIRNGIGN
ncbi:MAG: ATP-binding cassette domain-containing protein [Desulfurococcaceae archaeon]